MVSIHYLRPPGREQVFRQTLLHDQGGVQVTLSRALELDSPLVIDGRVALEPGSDAVWFTFRGAWHDIGLFHLADGTPTGLYANILTPPRILPGHVWHTVDLFLDLWLPPAGEIEVLDREEFDEAVEKGWIDQATRAAALAEVERILRARELGTWPPAVVGEWSRARALRVVGDR